MPLNIISKILKHKTAPNLFLMLMIFFGLFAAKQLNTQFFPNYSIDYIAISIEWPGASTQDIEDSVIKPLENKVRYLDKVKSTRATARQGRADVILEYESGTDMKNSLNELEMEVNAIDTFPQESEVPVITLINPYEQIGLVLINGTSNEIQLKKVASRLRDKLLNNGIDKIEIDSFRKQIIYIDLDPISLFSNKLDPEEVALRINPEIKNIPSGIFQSSSTLQLRTFSKKEKVLDIENIEIINPEGGKVKVKDIANVYETFNEKESQGFSEGKKAITLKIFRSLGSDVLENTKILESTVYKFKAELNSKINVQIYDLSSQLIRDRINLLLKNGLGGLVLVLLILFLFLKFRVVIWVAIGIPAAISVTLAIMLLTGQSINMISLFALIMMLGIIVDDSIVVAEHIEYQSELGKSPSEAAYVGAIRMLGPVTAASLTTIAGFAPVFLISGVIGQVIEAIPLVVISVIVASLFECFFVLPGHIKTALIEEAKNRKKRINLNKYLETFKKGTFLNFLTTSIKHKYKTFFSIICLLIISFSLLKFAHVKFYFFPAPESQIILVNFSFTPGTLKKNTIEFANNLEKKLKEIDKTQIVQTTYAVVGKPMWGSRISTKEFGDHVGGMIVELVSPEKRKKRTNELIKEWKDKLELPVGLTSLTILERKGGPPGLDIDIRIRSQNASLEELKKASNFVQSELLKLKGVTDIKDNLPIGEREIEFTLTEKGESLEFNSNYLAKKIKAIFDGVSVTKFFRGEDEIEIIVRNNLEAMNMNTFNSHLVLSPNGKLIPISEIVNMKKSQSFSTVKRNNGYREISVTGEINEGIVNPDDIMKEIKINIMKKVDNEFNLDWYLAGRAEEQKETFGDMKRGGLLAIAVIYIILAFIFQSYFLPFSIMSIIPFTLIGVIGGHWITGFDITILSLVAVFGLTGIVINDSIIMVANIFDKIEKGMEADSAIITGAQERLRAVILTSLTTIGGLTPLLFEGSVQAQFLKPMAITIVFGLLSSTLLVLIFIPVILKIGLDIRKTLFSPKFWS